MPSKLPSHTLAVSEAAEAVGVTIHSLRRWCEWHATHLTPGANPTPGHARRLSGVDIEVLRHVKSLRDEGLQTIAINEHLATLTFAEIDNLDQTNTALESSPALPDAPHATPAPIVAQDYYLSVERRLVALERSWQPSTITALGIGFLAACMLFLLLIGLAVAYGGVR